MNKFTTPVLITFMLTGCAVGPKIITDTEVPSIKNDYKNKKIIVTDFYISHYAVSATHSNDITTILESVNTDDISSEVSDILLSAGLESEARKYYTRGELQDNELMFTGVIARKPYWSLGYALCCGSIGLLIPIFLPMPYGTPYGVDVRYRFELVDKDGRIYLQTRENNLKVKYKSYYVLTGTKRHDDPPQFVLDRSKEEVFKIIRQMFKYQ
jgi:hypothetical protein